MGYKFMTIGERNKIKEMIRSGMKMKDIQEITGRGHATLTRIHNEMKNEEVLEPEVEKKEPEKYVTDLRDDPRWALHVEIEKIFKITGKKTEYRYMVSGGNMIIHNDFGQEFKIEFSMLDKFIDELIDIGTELRK